MISSLSAFVATTFVLLASALPTVNYTSSHDTRSASISGSINWFASTDCLTPCPTAYCTGLANWEGIGNSTLFWPGYGGNEEDNVGCWDRPDGVSSVAVSISNGHKFSGIVGKTCEEFKADGGVGETWDLEVGKWNGDSPWEYPCNVMHHEHTKAVFYHW